jgi:two-component system chemotaxis response regulator CheB
LNSFHKKIKLLIVDDSALIRAMFADMLAREPDIEVIGTAIDPFDAREKIKLLNPDVITLDVEMPKMDGITFLERIMALRPMPVVMVSSLTERGADITVRALEIGAVDYVTKPSEQNEGTLRALQRELATKIRSASQARVSTRAGETRKPPEQKLAYRATQSSIKLIAIGASTGGVEALRDVLQELPDTMPPIVITQHMPPKFTTSFAARLDSLCAPAVQEVAHQQRLEAGNIYLAQGDKHFSVHSNAAGQWIAQVLDGELVSGHRPSVNVLFRSVAKHLGNKAIGVILTGMGKDGAEGLLAMREAGARTLGQSEASCVVYGMPKAAQTIGAVERELPLYQIPKEIIRLCEGGVKWQSINTKIATSAGL